MQNTEKKYKSALDEYINRIYILILLLVPGACQCAGLLYTAEKILGFFPTVNWLALVIFDTTCLIYLATGIYFIRTGFVDGYVSAARLKAAKFFLVIIMFIQYNFILYMIPSTEFWGFALLFVIATAFFLDVKMVLATAIEISASLAVSAFLNGDTSLPIKDALFIPNVIARIVCLFLTLSFIVILTYLVSHFLVNAKKDEMERNNERISDVLAKVSGLSDNLMTAGSVLSQISTNESSSTEELAATSETLLTNSNALGEKADESLANLNELRKWADVVNANVEKVENTSKNLLDKSEDNEKLLHSLQGINAEVSRSMEDTSRVAARLSEAVKEIDVTLNLIHDISSSTNLLALNASIEAARAGEAGKGFAVVADEVGNLANSTKQSLDEVKNVIARVWDNVEEMARYVEENSNNLARQNEFFNHVFHGIQEMMQMLHHSMEDINTMGDAHDKQAEVIRGTITISEDIAENIRQENQEFSNINDMVDSNANDVADMTKQVAVINSMADEINALLNR